MLRFSQDDGGRFKIRMFSRSAFITPRCRCYVDKQTSQKKCLGFNLKLGKKNYTKSKQTSNSKLTLRAKKNLEILLSSKQCILPLKNHLKNRLNLLAKIQQKDLKSISQKLGRGCLLCTNKHFFLKTTAKNNYWTGEIFGKRASQLLKIEVMGSKVNHPITHNQGWCRNRFIK